MVPSDRAGADPGPTPHEPPDRGDSARSDLVILSGATGSSGRPRSAAIGPLDPRRPPETLTDRDVSALAFIGRSQEAAQYQLHEAVFPGLGEAVVSRRIRKLAARGLLAIERWNKVGINRLRLRPAGLEAVVERKGARDDELFLLRAPLAQSAVAHHLWVVDCRLIIDRLPAPPTSAQPSWVLERRWNPRPAAIPDVLAIWRPTRESPGHFLALEVDIGTEAIRRTFVPRLVALAETLVPFAGTSPAFISVLTRGSRRVAAIQQAVASASIALPVVVDSLPPAAGRPAFAALRTLLTVGAKSPSHPGPA
ncbi:MAG: hypothetical protein IPP07_25505 [Holophagales bacterium]|nr:hypothetical protein [Holophagales bacterium]